MVLVEKSLLTRQRTRTETRRERRDEFQERPPPREGTFESFALFCLKLNWLRVYTVYNKIYY